LTKFCFDLNAWIRGCVTLVIREAVGKELEICSTILVLKAALMNRIPKGIIFNKIARVKQRKKILRNRRQRRSNKRLKFNFNQMICQMMELTTIYKKNKKE